MSGVVEFTVHPRVPCLVSINLFHQRKKRILQEIFRAIEPSIVLIFNHCTLSEVEVHHISKQDLITPSDARCSYLVLLVVVLKEGCIAVPEPDIIFV